MRQTIAILVDKLVAKFFKLIGSFTKYDGSVLPGCYATMIDRHILDKIKYPPLIIGVTGSSGKGSTTALIAHILTQNGLKVIWNKNGSNVYNAAATLILNNTKAFSKQVEADVLLLELDESFIKEIFNKVKLTHLVITNITRDQPARNGHVDIIYDKIKSAIDKQTHLIINADDPIVSRIKLTHEGPITTYGIGKCSTDLLTPLSFTFDGAYCPKCHTKLQYAYYHYGHLGNYKCPKCKFARGKVNYEGKDVNLENQFMTINKTLVHLNKDVFFAAYYTLAAYATCHTIGILEEDIVKELNDDVMESKRLKSQHLHKREVVMLESKNENALSYLQSINYIKKQPGKKTLIIGFDNVSRRYRENDISWLYDVDFELLNDETIDKIFIIGRFRYDVYTRLKYAHIADKKLVLVDEVNNVIKLVADNSKGKIYTMVCFDMTAILKNLLNEVAHENN